MTVSNSGTTPPPSGYIKHKNEHVWSLANNFVSDWTKKMLCRSCHKKKSLFNKMSFLFFIFFILFYQLQPIYSLHCTKNLERNIPGATIDYHTRSQKNHLELTVRLIFFNVLVFMFLFKFSTAPALHHPQTDLHTILNRIHNCYTSNSHHQSNLAILCRGAHQN